jgi:hypothetical protein
MKRTAWILAIALSVAALPQWGVAGELRAGVAKVEITPPAEGTYLSGYAARTSGSIGVLDPLYARALVLDCDGRRMALVSMDIIEFPSERVPREAKERLGVGLVLMAASHTHEGPNFNSRRWTDGMGMKLYRQTEDRVLEAIEQASKNLFPARLATAKGEIPLGYHRLVMQPDGRRKPLFQNPERLPVGPIDPTVSIIRVEDAEAKTTRAVVVGYACHPVCMGHRNRLIGGDYAGVMEAEVEKALSTRGTDRAPTCTTLCMFVQGGGGSINPLFMEMKTGEPGATTEHRKMGELLAGEVLRAVRKSRPIEGPNEVLWRTKQLTFADRWSTTATVPVSMAAVLINRTIGIAAVPGEPFLALQTQFKEKAPVEFPLFAGYTTIDGAEWPDYIPDLRSAAEGGYGADSSTHIEVGAAERIVNQAVADLYWMKAMFQDKPGK